MAANDSMERRAMAAIVARPELAEELPRGTWNIPELQLLYDKIMEAAEARKHVIEILEPGSPCWKTIDNLPTDLTGDLAQYLEPLRSRWIDRLMEGGQDEPTEDLPEPAGERPNFRKSELEAIGTDMDRAETMVRRYQSTIRWCQDIRTWLVWNGVYWQHDRTLLVNALAMRYMNEACKQAQEAMDTAGSEDECARYKKLLAVINRGRMNKAINDMISLMKPNLPITAGDLDADPFLLNCQNGVADLRTGIIAPHLPDHYMTKVAGSSYLPGAGFKLFGEFLDMITEGDKSLQDYFQVICGMAAIGKVFYEGLCVFYGDGSNGKSTFLNTVSKVFGDYACTINPDILMAQRDGRENIGKAEVRGKRLVTAIETEEGKRISTATLKQLSSTDPITARRLYENPLTFQPSHTLILATNHLPKVGSTDSATWRRIAVVPFKVKINPVKEIKDYSSILYQEDGDAVLTWIIEGAVRYIAGGYQIQQPEAVTQTTTNYKDEENWLQNFLMECCEADKDKPELRVMGGHLYDAYSDWCQRNSEYRRRPRDFAAALQVVGYTKKHIATGTEWYGIRLVSSADLSGGWNKYTRASGPASGERSAIADMTDDDGLTPEWRRNM